MNTMGSGLRPRSVDLHSLIANREGALRDILVNNIQLETELAPKSGQVSIDLGDFEQMLMILTLNAREGMPQGADFSLKRRWVERLRRLQLQTLSPDKSN